MKKAILASIPVLLIILLPACSSVKFYSNPGLTQNSGLKYYTAKPFILVERDPVNNDVIKTTVVYLPDLSNPQYMVFKEGFGSCKVDVKLTDGSISTFGMDSDAKIAETIEAFTAMMTKGASAISDLSTLKNNLQAGITTPVTELYEVFMGAEGTTLKKVEFR